MACLSSRIPYGEAVTEEKLAMIEQAENCIRDLGFYDVRVRHHELKGAPPIAGAVATTSHLARIEVGVSELRRLLENETATKIAVALKEIGYQHVTLDLQGYRRGSVNEAAPARATRVIA
jgi:uncharacterized protein